jgi:hypothetical protein
MARNPAVRRAKRAARGRRRTPVSWSPPRAVAQLAEHRSPKPGVAGSSPAGPVARSPLPAYDSGPRAVSRGRAEKATVSQTCPELLAAQPGEGSRSEAAFPALLLAGYAIENYAKARLVEQGKDWKRHGHDLSWLVKQAGIELNEPEKILVQRLKQIVVWAGRYPTPMKPEEFNLPPGEEWPQQATIPTSRPSRTSANA